jgi:hypothetical protein
LRFLHRYEKLSDHGILPWYATSGEDVADQCDPIRSQLQDLREQRRTTPKFLEEMQPRPHRPHRPLDPVAPEPDPDPAPVEEPLQNRLNPVWSDLDAKVVTAERSLRACEESLIPNTPVPLTLTLTSFDCRDQSDEIGVTLGPIDVNTESDEPYAVVFAVDIAPTSIGAVPVGVLNSKATLVGPLSGVVRFGGVSPGGYAAPSNVIWGLSNAPGLVTAADNLFVIVAMMENDDSSPDQVRSGLELAAKVGLSNVGLLAGKAITREEFVSRIIAEMDGAAGVVSLGFPGPDDHIGGCQELRFGQGELDHIYRGLGPIERSLRFVGDNAEYIVHFRMS